MDSCTLGSFSAPLKSSSIVHSREKGIASAARLILGARMSTGACRKPALLAMVLGKPGENRYEGGQVGHDVNHPNLIGRTGRSRADCGSRLPADFAWGPCEVTPEPEEDDEDDD
jgi:hypothetical protein